MDFLDSNDVTPASSEISQPVERHDPYAAIAAEGSEPAVIRAWRLEQQQRLSAQEEKDAAQQAELAAKAKADLQEFFELYAAKNNETANNNRHAEQDFIALQNDKTEGHDWERVARLIDFTAKGRNQRDVTKLKSLLLQLKQDGLHPL